MTIHLYKNDLPNDLKFGSIVAIDTETLGLKPHRDRLCLVQLSAGDGISHLIQFEKEGYLQAKNLRALLTDTSILKLFHFARFDVAVLSCRLGVFPAPIYCTKIASKLARTFTDRHSLKDLCKDLLSIEMSKQEQSSDWGASDLTSAQKTYAASDVLHLHRLKEKLDVLLEREERTALAQSCFDFVIHRAQLDLLAGEEFDIFEH